MIHLRISPCPRLRASRPARREASLNWLAFGLLLAAWNAVGRYDDSPVVSRPRALRGYATVSVRAAHLSRHSTFHA